MNPGVLAAVATAAITAGLLLIVAGVRARQRPESPPPRSLAGLAALVGVGLPVARRRRRRMLLVSAGAVTVAVWMVSGWPVAGLLAGLGVLGAPWLVAVGAAEQQAITRLEAVEVWTRRLRDLVRTGHGLISGIVTSARTAPTPIAEPVRDLAAALQAGADPQQALERFADTLADFHADEVIAALLLHVSDRGQRLSEVLEAVAAATSREVVMRRGVAAKRAEPRFVTRFMAVLIAVVVVVVLTNTSYAAPYATTVGQLVLLALALALVGLLTWIARLTRPPAPHRFLGPASGPRRSPPAATGGPLGGRR